MCHEKLTPTIPVAGSAGLEDSSGLGYPLSQVYLDACHSCYKCKRGFVVGEPELGDKLAIQRNLLERAARYF